MAKPIEYCVERDDILKFDADVVAFKYAQRFYGADEAAASALGLDWASSGKGPAPGETRLLDTGGRLTSRQALFVGAPPLKLFGYPAIRDFGRAVLTALAQSAPETRTLGITIQGASFGLDEKECLDAELAGLMDAVNEGAFPPKLAQISILERGVDRSLRFHHRLQEIFQLRREGRRGAKPPSPEKVISSARDRLGAVGYESAQKRSIFVAMPFAKDMEDVYHYGIERPVNTAGYLCERADMESFTGDIMDWLQERIERSTFVIAEVSQPNPNVYLEIGYAWGRRKDVILAANNSCSLPFDIRGHRCLKYEIIRDLEKQLEKMLADLG